MREFCETERIEVVDLLPAFRGRHDRDLWVHPSDRHPNPAGHAIAALLDAGAADAWACPIVGKKGRPALTLSALAPRERSDQVARALLRETSTIGLRRTAVRRIERPRRQELVSTRFGDIPVKISSGMEIAPQVKPEFDACAQAAKRHDVPVREVIAEALAACRAEHERD